MEAQTSPGVVEFEQFRLDRRAGRLMRRTGHGEFEPVSIGSRAVGVLSILIDRSGNLVSKDEIMAAVWPDTVVEEANLTVQISALRRILDQGRHDGSCIRTVPGRGYRFLPILAQADAGPTPSAPATSVTDGTAAPPGRKIKMTVAGAAALAGLLASGGWWILKSSTAPVSVTTASPEPLPDRRLSIIIFPFESSSGRVAPDSLAAEITREVTARFVRSGEGPVITGQVSEGEATDLRTVGLRYNVHFALTGHARRQDGRLIVAANLYETATNQAVWGRQFDVPDSPTALASITQVIYESAWQASVDVEALHAQRDRPTHLDKRDLLWIGNSTSLATPTKAHYVEKLSLVDHALELDPNYLMGLERQARWRAELVLFGYSSDPAADLAIATKAADHALSIDPNSLNALRVKATVLRAQGDWTAAEALLRRVLILQPTEANRHSELAQTLMAQGRHQEGLASFQTARRLAGGADGVYFYDANIALAELALGQFADAIATAHLAIGEMPPDTGRIGELPLLALIAATSASGNEEAARSEMQRFLAVPRNWRSMAEVQKWPAFVANPPLLDGLRHAGMPAE